MMTRLMDGIGRYPSQPCESVGGWSLLAWTVAGWLRTPDYAILTAQGIGHAPGWVWMLGCALLGASQLACVRAGHSPGRHLCAALGCLAWVGVWLALYWGHGAVAALTLIPIFFACEFVGFVQTESPRLRIHGEGGP